MARLPKILVCQKRGLRRHSAPRLSTSPHGCTAAWPLHHMSAWYPVSGLALPLARAQWAIAYTLRLLSLSCHFLCSLLVKTETSTAFCEHCSFVHFSRTLELDLWDSDSCCDTSSRTDMTSHAKLLHGWLLEEAGPQPSTHCSGDSASARPAAAGMHLVALTDTDLHATPESKRRDSFNLVMVLAMEEDADATRTHDTTPIACPTPAMLRTKATGSLTGPVNEDDRVASTRALTHAAGAETIELRDLPWHPLSQHSVKGPTPPPLARLPRR